MIEPGYRREPDIAFAFGHDLAAPRAARKALQPLFRDDLEIDEDTAEAVNLVASELVSNVVLHTSDGGQLRAWAADPVRLEVHDHDPRLPVQVDGPAELGGRGLNIVDGVADDWGAELDGDGKVLWAEFRRHADR